MTKIVVVNVALTNAPTPSTLQRTGAFISQGQTNTTPGTYSLLTQASDYTPLVPTAKTLTAATWLANVATFTLATTAGWAIGATFSVVIAGVTPAGYNGTYIATVTTATQFTVPLTTNPGTSTVQGTVTVNNTEVLSMVTTYFGQGSANSVYVLEVGAGNATQGVPYLTAWITANPGVFYSYLVPRNWDGVTAFLTLVASFEAPNSQTYFFVTTTLATYTLYTALMKDVIALIECPAYGIWPANAITASVYATGQVTVTTTTAHGVTVGQWFTIVGETPSGYNGTFQAQAGTTGSTLIYNVSTALGSSTVQGTLVASTYASAGIPATEFSMAAVFWQTLDYNPSSTNKVTPLSYSFVYGVTPYPTQGNASILQTLQNANINVIGTGAQGGLPSNTIILYGTTMDGNPFNYWYNIDWAAINITLNVANFVINGSNNPINPVYLNQAGINGGQKVIASTMTSGVTFGIVLNPVIEVELSGPAFTAALDNGVYNGYTAVNAVPFPIYYTASPSDYKIGKYAGYSAVFAPLRGFQNIIINLDATTFVA